MYNWIKRFFDFIFALIAIVLLLPILLPIVLLLKITGEGEVFYLQQRIGYKNRVFNIFKFATMIKNSPNIGSGTITQKNDPRVLPVGQFLRKTKLNELPQLVNVLIGDLSIVGPRPLTEETFNAYADHVKQSIYNVKPGITGIGSIVFRDEESLFKDYSDKKTVMEIYKSRISVYKGELEIWYLRNISFITDLWLIVFTALVIVFPTSKLYLKVFKDLPKQQN